MAAAFHVQIVVKKNKFGACSAIMSKAVAQAFAQLGETSLKDMQARTPVLTGALRASETMSAGPTELRLTADTDHCVYVEFGTRKMAAEPYMRPAVANWGGQVGGLISQYAEPAFDAL
jgi:HK97 gp10 family phage protein